MIYKLFNPTESIIQLPADLALAPQGSVCVAFNHALLAPAFLWESVADAGVVAYALDGSIINPTEALDTLYTTQRRAQLFPTGGVRWNIMVCPDLTTEVRNEMIVADLSALGVTVSQLLTKLEPVTGLLQLGMFKEASRMLPKIPVDGFLTPTRLASYSEICVASDAIK